jgi:hypothetical protein
MERERDCTQDFGLSCENLQLGIERSGMHTRHKGFVTKGFCQNKSVPKSFVQKAFVEQCTIHVPKFLVHTQKPFARNLYMVSSKSHIPHDHKFKKTSKESKLSTPNVFNFLRTTTTI